MNDYPKWKDRPACEGTDTELWFNEDDKPTYQQYATLKKICKGCPVRQQCLDYALKHDVFGFWGGTTPRERQRIRGKLNIKCEPVMMHYDRYE